MKILHLEIWLGINILVSFALGHAMSNNALHESGGALFVAMAITSWVMNILMWPHHEHKLTIDDIEKRGYIKLIAEDFDTLEVDTPTFRLQYENGADCPIARHFKRLGFLNPSITYSRWIVYSGNVRHNVNVDIYISDVRRAAEQIKSGKRYGVIKFR